MDDAGGQMNLVLTLLIGLFAGAAIAGIIWLIARGGIKESFKSISYDALSNNSEQFFRLAKEWQDQQTAAHEKELENKKGQIDQTFDVMQDRLKDVQQALLDFQKDHKQQFGEINSQLKNTADQNIKLHDVTSRLQTALASSRVRGNWGERMAEDILRLVGFVEGINYKKQKALESGRPDYTFMLPQKLIVNMDVKFPFDNYQLYVEAREDSEKQKRKEQFLKDVKSRIKEVTTRDYINPAANTVDYVILFIPNEQIYAFINESDSSILDEALRNKVILCSPLTLYAILAVIRQAVDNFNLEKTAGQILQLLGTFNKQWGLFIESMDKMGKRIDDARSEFDALVSTRRNQLERPLRQIEQLRTRNSQNIEILPDESKQVSEESQETEE